MLRRLLQSYVRVVIKQRNVVILRSKARLTKFGLVSSGELRPNMLRSTSSAARRANVAKRPIAPLSSQ